MSVVSPAVAPYGSFGGTAGAVTSNSTFQNMQVRGDLYAKHATLQGDLRVNAFHGPYANILMGSGGRLAEGDFVAGGVGSTAVIPDLTFTAIPGGVNGTHQLEIQDGGKIILQDVTGAQLIAGSVLGSAVPTLAVPGMHHWSIALKKSGAMQYDHANDKFRFGKFSGQGYQEGNGAVSELMGIEASSVTTSALNTSGAITSSVTPVHANLDSVPQFVMEYGAEKWRIALVNDLLSGYVKFAIQRYVGPGNSTTGVGSEAWETVSDFQGSENVISPP